MNTDDLTPHQLAQVLEEVAKAITQEPEGVYHNLMYRVAVLRGEIPGQESELRASAAGAGKGEPEEVTPGMMAAAMADPGLASFEPHPAADRSQDARDEEVFRLWAKRVGYADLDEAEWARNGWHAALRYSREAQP